MARGGGSIEASDLSATFNDAHGAVTDETFQQQLEQIKAGDRVVVYADPLDRLSALEAARAAYECGASSVDVTFFTGAGNEYSMLREDKARRELVVPSSAAPARDGFADHERVAYAQNILTRGLSLTDGDKLVIRAHPEHAPLIEQVVRGAYERGAHIVDVHYIEPRQREVMAREARQIPTAPEVSWQRERIQAAMDDGACLLNLTDNETMNLGAGIDKERWKAQALTEDFTYMQPFHAQQAANRLRWCFAEAPTSEWAQRVYPELDNQAALHQLAQDLLEFTHTDGAGGAIEAGAMLQERSRALNKLDLVALKLTSEDDSLDLDVPLLEGSRFLPCEWDTVSGEQFACNLPSSEIFTSPDSQRVSGRVVTSRPVMLSGRQVDRIELEFEDGQARLVSCEPAAMTKLVEAYLRADAGSGRIGEIGLVAGSRIGAKDRLYYNSTIDENAVTHIGLGFGYDAALSPDADKHGTNNQSAMHYDLMLGRPGMTVVGVTRSGEHVSLLQGDTWLV